MTAILAISSDRIKVRWTERYISQAVNQQAGAHPAGCYRGLHLAPTAPASAVVTLEQINPWGVDEGEHFAVVADRAGGWVVAVRETGSIALDLTAALPLHPGTPTALLYVYLTAIYAPDAATVANWEYQWATDPRIADPTAIVVGVLLVPLAAIVLDFDPVPGSAALPTVLQNWTVGTTDAQRNVARFWRSRPTADIMVTDGDALASYQSAWGMIHGVERTRIPTKNQKDALNAAAAPTAANAVATIADVTALEAHVEAQIDAIADKVVGEPQRVNLLAVASGSPGRSYVVMDCWNATPLGWYVGRGNAASAAAWFDVHAAATSAPLADTLDGALVRITSVQVFRAATGWITLNPSAHADVGADGFIYDGTLVGAGVLQIRLVLDTDGVSGAYVGGVDVWCTGRATIEDWSVAPARALPVAARWRQAHAAEHSLRRYAGPPGTPLAATATVQDAVRRLQLLTRGGPGQGATDAHVAAGSFWQAAAPDQPEVTPWATGNLGALVPTAADDYNLLAVGVVGNDRVIGVFTTRTGVGDDFLIADAVTRTALFLGHVADRPATEQLVAVASDGIKLYARTYDVISTEHYLRAYRWSDLANGLSVAVWTLLLGTSAAGYADPFNNPIDGATVAPSHANAVAVVGPNAVAVNFPWGDIHGAAAAIRVVNATTGAWAGAGGYGDAQGAPWYTNVGPVHACGPICGDGTNIFFCVKSVDAADHHLTFVASCQIANTALSNYVAWADASRLFGIAPDALMHHGQEPRGLVYDGALLWASAANGIWCAVPGGYGYQPTPAAPGAAAWEYQVNGGGALLSRVGPVVTDGRFAYVAVVGAGAAGGGYMRLYRLTGQGLPGEGLVGAAPTMAELTEQVWRLSAPEELATVGPFGAADGTVGPALFDGDNVWVAPIDRWDGAEPKSQVMYRVPLVRGW